MAHYLVSGAAGFIGARTSAMLVQDGHSVVGIDNLNDAYDVRMKEHRLGGLRRLAGFEFRRMDISTATELEGLVSERFDAVIHLAARAGVRASVENPELFYQTGLAPMALNSFHRYSRMAAVLQGIQDIAHFLQTDYGPNLFHDFLLDGRVPGGIAPPRPWSGLIVYDLVM